MYENYAKLRDDKGLTDYRVSKETGIARAILSDWKNGKTNLELKNLLILSTYFKVPLDYLVNGEMIANEDVLGCYARYSSKRGAYGYTDEEVAIALRMPYKTFENWSKGKYSPDVQHLSNIADYLNTSLDYLLTGKNKEEHIMSDFDYAIINAFHMADDIDRTSVLRTLHVDTSNIVPSEEDTKEAVKLNEKNSNTATGESDTPREAK